jgi:hypothetical protein
MNVPPPPPPPLSSPVPMPIPMPTPMQSYNASSHSNQPANPNVPHSQAAPHLYNAINSAFDSSAAATQVPSDLISQITEQVRTQVIDSLRAEFASKAAGHQTTASTSAPASAAMPYSTGHPQQQQTPMPPPYPNASNPNLNIPMPPPGQQQQQQQQYAPGSQNGFFSGGSASTSTTSAPPRAVHTPPTPNPASSGDSDDAQPFFDVDAEEARPSTRDMPGRRKSDFSGAARPKEDLSGRFGERQRQDASRERPPPTRSMTDEEETVLEKMWQPLFDDGAMPTARLGQLLRGIALHLIEDLEPKSSLVVGPKKMKRFFEQMKVSDEVYPWAGKSI